VDNFLEKLIGEDMIGKTIFLNAALYRPAYPVGLYEAG